AAPAAAEATAKQVKPAPVEEIRVEQHSESAEGPSTPMSRPASLCENFEARQEPQSVASMLHRADCYGRGGRTATAWSLVRSAAVRAHNEGDAQREAQAAARAEDLEKRLSKLTLRTHPQSRLDNVEVRLNGVLIPRASWGTPIPVDPGKQRVDAA